MQRIYNPGDNFDNLTIITFNVSFIILNIYSFFGIIDHGRGFTVCTDIYR
jgi:hypothetical protein